MIVSNAAGSQLSQAATLTVTAAAAGTDVLTYKYDAMRTGQDLTESVLTPDGQQLLANFLAADRAVR